MLTDTQCRNAVCPADKKRVRLSDAGNLYLEVAPAGSRRWFWKFTTGGKEKRLALGAYPQVSLSAARLARDSARGTLASGTDPAKQRRDAKVDVPVDPAAAFSAISTQWYNTRLPSWSPAHAKRSREQLDRDLLPYIGGVPMVDITPAQITTLLNNVQARGSYETAHRVLAQASQVFEYWLPDAPRGSTDPTIGLKVRLRTPTAKHFPAIIEPQRFGDLLRALRSYRGGLIVRCALQLSPLLYQRPGNLRMMEWSELDLDGATWTIASAKMKRTVQDKVTGEPHVVPLPSQAVALLRDIQPLTGHGQYVFPSERDKARPISDATLRAGLYALGFGEEQSVHGFRASARTMLAEVLDFDPLVIEANLAHAVKDSNGRSYNRTVYLKQRVRMAQAWADYLDVLTAGNVIDIRRAA